MRPQTLNAENVIIALMVVAVLAIWLISACVIVAGIFRYAYLRLKNLRNSPYPAGVRFQSVFTLFAAEAKRVSFRGAFKVLFENPREGIFIYICMLVSGFVLDAIWAIVVRFAFSLIK